MDGLYIGRSRQDILEGAEAAFFVTELARHAPEGTSLPVYDTEKKDSDFTHEWTRIVGDYKVVDQWDVTLDTGCFGGRTVIYCLATTLWVPVWQMNYQGSYPLEVVPLVESALVRAYSQRQFFGGRGETGHWVSGNSALAPYVYRNGHAGNFKNFTGRETVAASEDLEKVFGYCQYMGKAMI
jgi:hypothetical protein